MFTVAPGAQAVPGHGQSLEVARYPQTLLQQFYRLIFIGESVYQAYPKLRRAAIRTAR
jgi:hypothetical protein